MSFGDYKKEVAEEFSTEVSERVPSDIIGGDGVEVDFEATVEDVEAFLAYLGIDEYNYTEHPLDSLEDEFDTLYQYETTFEDIGLEATPSAAFS